VLTFASLVCSRVNNADARRSTSVSDIFSTYSDLFHWVFGVDDQRDHGLYNEILFTTRTGNFWVWVWVSDLVSSDGAYIVLTLSMLSSSRSSTGGWSRNQLTGVIRAACDSDYQPDAAAALFTHGRGSPPPRSHHLSATTSSSISRPA